MTRTPLKTTLGRLAAAALVAGGLALSIGLSAANAAQPLPRPDLTSARVRPGTLTVEVSFIDKAGAEDGYEIIARVPTTDGSINVTTKMLPGALAGTGSAGHGVIDLKAGQRYCLSVRAYTFDARFDTFGPKSDEICLTMPVAPATQAPASSWPVVREGSAGEAVTSLQHLLRQQGIELVVDGDFGAQTTQAVRAFQQAKGLGVDGIVGPQTWQALIVTVRQGSQGEAVVAVQRQLAARGIDVVIDGDFGEQTVAAVRAYQQAKGLGVDGIVGRQTWQALLNGK